MADTWIEMEPRSGPRTCPSPPPSRESLARELGAWHATGLRIAVWGGDTESAAFLQAHRMDSRRFPLVIDSLPALAGTVLPATGQTVRSPAWLRRHPVDIILVPCAWRAPQAVREIDAAGVNYEGILIPHDGGLVDFLAADHPYGSREPVPA